MFNIVFRFIAILIATLYLLPAQASSKVLSQFQADAPADTIFYIEASLHELPNTGTAGLMQGSQIEQFLDMLDDASVESRTAESKFLVRIIEDYASVLAEGSKKLNQHYGLSSKNEFALYLDGITPVVHLAVKSPNAIRDILIQLSTDSGVNYQAETWKNTPVFIWDLFPERDAKFAVVFEKKRVTLGFYLGTDNEERKFKRLGLVAEDDSVATSNSIADIQDKYQFADAMQGYLNFVELARVGIQPGQNSFGVDYQVIDSNLSTPLSEVCQLESLALVESMPRLVMGYDEIKTRGSQVSLQASTILEMKNTSIITELNKLNGHLSDLSMNQKGQIFSVALGLDVEQLSPVVTQLWTQFLNSEFECEKLVELQTTAEASNPAAIAIAAAMAQGLQGISLSVFDLDISDIETLDYSLDALVTLSSAKPALLAGLLANIPQLKGIQPPSNGDAIPLTSLGLPENQTPSMAIRGDHLTLFVGETSRRMANELMDEKLNHQGLFGMSFDYAKLYDLLAVSLMETPEFTREMDATSCAQVYSSIFPLSSMDATATINGRFSSHGFVSGMALELLNVNKNVSASIVGDYKLEQLIDGCIWNQIGEESLKNDGSGSYSVSDSAGQCLVYGSDYQWSQTGARIKFDIIHSESRESCDQEFIPDDVSNYDCVIVDQNRAGFSCMFSYDDGYQEIYRYLKK